MSFGLLYELEQDFFFFFFLTFIFSVKHKFQRKLQRTLTLGYKSSKAIGTQQVARIYTK